MRTEAEIRGAVEARLRRWGLLALNGILWVGAAKLIYGYSQYGNFGQFAGAVILFMIVWAALFGLHALRVFYVELRERLVRRAVEREREFYQLQVAYEKRKHEEPLPRLSDDGELIDFPEWSDAEGKLKRER